MEFFDKSIRDGALTPKHHSLSTGKNCFKFSVLCSIDTAILGQFTDTG